MGYQSFWQKRSFAVVGHSERKKFPMLTYKKLKESGRAVFPVDPGVDRVAGDKAYPDLAALPQEVEAAVLELPADETESWVRQAIAADIRNIWIHQGCETPGAISLAGDSGVNLLYGTCAVMYLSDGFSLHAFHGWINRRLGKY